VVIPSIIEATNHYFQHKDQPGTGGTDRWTFTAINTGEEIVKLAYAPEYNREDVSEWVEICFKVE
jgi:predicted secreted protein